MGKLERLAIVVALAAAGLAVVAVSGCGSVEASTDDAGHDAGAAGAGGSSGAGAAGGRGGSAGTAAAAGAPPGGTSGAAGAGVGGSAGAGGSGGAGQADAGDAGELRACGAPVRNVGVPCTSKSGGLSCASCVATTDNAPRVDCKGSISGVAVYCFPAGVPEDVSGCESCP